MNKQEFFNLFSSLDDFEIAKLYNKYNLAKNKEIEVITDEFYTPEVWGTLESLKEFPVTSFGAFEECDRRLIGFYVKEPSNFFVRVIKVECNTKFSKLEHKDYLGAIMALGIKREKMGDLILDQSGCYIAIQEEMSDYILGNLNKIKNLTCKCKLIEDTKKLPTVKYEEKVYLAASMRLDCVISSICNISRSKATELIGQGKVYVNYIPIKRKDFEMKKESKLTIRGFGKFKIADNIGNTKSGRLKLTVFKYV